VGVDAPLPGTIRRGVRVSPPLTLHKRTAPHAAGYCVRARARATPPTPSTHTGMSNADGFFSPFGVSIIPSARARARAGLLSGLEKSRHA